MSASRRAPKPRYVLTPDRDRIALVAGGLCGFVVMFLSVFVQQHLLVETIFRAMVAMVVTYSAAHIVLLLVAYLRDTQSVVVDAAVDQEVEETEIE